MAIKYSHGQELFGVDDSVFKRADYSWSAGYLIQWIMIYSKRQFRIF